MLLQLLQYLLNSFYMLFAFTFNVNKDVIKIYYHKNNEFFC